MIHNKDKLSTVRKICYPKEAVNGVAANLILISVYQKLHIERFLIALLNGMKISMLHPSSISPL